MNILSHEMNIVLPYDMHTLSLYDTNILLSYDMNTLLSYNMNNLSSCTMTTLLPYNKNTSLSCTVNTLLPYDILIIIRCHSHATVAVSFFFLKLVFKIILASKRCLEQMTKFDSDGKHPNSDIEYCTVTVSKRASLCSERPIRTPPLTWKTPNVTENMSQ